MKKKHLYIAIPLLGLIALIATKVGYSDDCPLLVMIGILAGTGFFLSSGLPFVDILTRKMKINGLEKTLFVMATSLLMIYPAGVLNVVIEGKENIYQEHLTGLMLILIGFFVIGWIGTKLFKVQDEKIQFKPSWILFGILICGFVFRVLNLGEANMNGDELDLAVISYDLVDGMVAGRNAYFISQAGHSPLGFYISHAFYNLFEPNGFYELKGWMIRMPQVLMGMLTIFATYVLSRNFLGKNQIAYIPPLLIVLDSYSNFASRLAIFQDLSTFAFFVIVLILAIRTSRLVGVSLGSLLLVKFSGVLFVPMLLFLRKWKTRLKELVIAAVIFIPVIFYNIAAYITTGYMDVPFSKIVNLIGIPAKSIMTMNGDSNLYGGLRNPLATLVEMPFMLMDQWGIAMSIFFIASGVAAIYFYLQKKSRKEYALIFSAIALSVIFFSLNGFRAYYMTYFSVLFAILVALNFQHIKREKLIAVGSLILVLPYTLFFNINTNILLKEPEEIREWGRSGEAELQIKYEMHNFSLSDISFLSDAGWDELLGKINTNDFLILDDDLNYLRVKWYLHVDDIIREFYGDENYEEAYDYIYLSEWDGEEGIVITRERKDFKGERVVYDSHGNAEFYLYNK